MSAYRRLRFVAPLRARRPDHDLEGEIAFLPMEAIGEDGTFDREQTRPAEEVRDQGYTWFCEGDVIRARVTPCFENGKGALLTGLAGGEGLGTTELFVFRPGPDIDSRFLFYVTRCVEFVQKGAATIYGAHGVKRVDEAFARDYWVWLPPLEEQRAISDYLDRETGRIDALIAAKKRTVALYRERRQALRDLTFRFTPGLKLKHLLAGPMAYGVLVPEFVVQGDRVPMIRTYNLRSRGSVDHQDLAEIPRALADQYKRTYLRDGDVILSVVGSMGRSAVATPAEAGCNLNRPLARLRPRSELPSRLLWHWTQTTLFADAAALATGGGTAQPTLNLGDLGNFVVGLPADSGRWRPLLAELEATCARLDELEDAAEGQISLLEERRQALITALVKGDLPVSVAA